MTEENAEALQIGVGVAATCIGVMCSLYHCCCHVWRRLKGHNPAVAAGAAVAAGVVAAGQLAAGASAGAASGHGATAATPSCRPQPACPRDEETCRVNMVRENIMYIFGLRLVSGW
jgi:hypothetical protein